jgi:hypothetical protein
VAHDGVVKAAWITGLGTVIAAIITVSFVKGNDAGGSDGGLTSPHSESSGDSKSATPTTSAGDKDSYIAEADAICQDASKRLTTLLDEVVSKTALEDKADGFEAYNDEFASAMSDVSDLRRPEEDAYLLNSMFRSANAHLEAEDDVVNALRTSDRSAAENAQDSADAAWDQTVSVAREYGLTECPPTADY